MNDNIIKVIERFHKNVIELENEIITTRVGHKLSARIWMPADAETKPVPAILEFLPYRKRDGTAERDELTHPYYAGHGYACVRVDMRGSGDSTGVLEGEYLQSEQDEALEVLDWIVQQPWCSGKTGMIGISWGGFNGLQVAALRPPSLKAIVTIASTDDRYADDIHYMGGVMVKDNLTWGSTMFAYNGRPPDAALIGESWRDEWIQRLEANDPWILEWLEHQTRDAFWQHGSVCDNYDDIECAVYAVGGWADGYSNAVPRLVSKLSSPSKGLIGPWAHKYPHFALPGPRIGFLQETVRWWDHWLKGIVNGIQNEPAYRAWMQDSAPPKTHYTTRDGHWVAESQWPSDTITDLTLHLSDYKLKESAGDNESVLIQTPLSMGARQGTWCGHGANPDSPNDQREDDGCSVVFETKPLDEDLQIWGAPSVQLNLSSSEPDAFVVARLTDVAPDGSSTRVTYGVLNLTHRNSHEHPEALVPGKTYSVTIQLNDIAQTFPAGNRVRLALSNTLWPMFWPSPRPVALSLSTSGSSLILPSRAAQHSDDSLPPFPAAESAPPQNAETIEAGDYQRLIEKDETTGESRITVIDDSGLTRLPELGWEHGTVSRQYFAITEGDPNSASIRTHWTTRSRRPDQNIDTRVETHTTLTSTDIEFNVIAKLEAFENNESIYSKTWDKSVKRRLN